MKEGHWTQEEEDELKQIKTAVQGLKANKHKALNEMMRNMVEGNIKERSEALKVLQDKKSSLLHDTAEEFGSKRCNDLIVKLSFYKNK